MDLPVLTLVLSDSHKWNQWDYRPSECCHCPFATPSCDRDATIEAPNAADEGEGRYDCRLLALENVWGENPKCFDAKWREALSAELLAAGIEYDKISELFRSKGIDTP